MASRAALKRASLSSSRLQAACHVQRRTYASHEPDYHEPSGLLFGEPIRPLGVKRQREDWELLWIYGMGGAILFGSAIIYFKPDTSITSAALVEAKKRLEARGDSAKYIPSSSRSDSS